MKTLWRRMIQSAISVSISFGVLFVLIAMLHSVSATQAGAAPSRPMVLAEYQAWFGLSGHPTPYTSTDPVAVANEIRSAQAQKIHAFIVDWYGPPANVPPSESTKRQFIDQATAVLFQQAEPLNFQAAILYDEGAVSATGAPTYMTRVISDLLYAKQYFTSAAYLKINGHPALFVFPYPQVDTYIDWAAVRSQLGVSVTLIDEDPNPADQSHDVQFDGFYAWVQPSHYPWSLDGTDWGHDYLTWWYGVMTGLAPTYTSRIAIGGTWPGFDDLDASWGQGRYIWPRCGQTWRDTWQLADQYQPPFVMISTWNDFEEDTAIEYGTGDCLTPSPVKSVLPGQQASYTHTLVNTGKFTDTFDVSTSASDAWPVLVSFNAVTLTRHASTTLLLTVSVPPFASSGGQDMLAVTVTSELSPAVDSCLTDTTTVQWGVYLPMIRKN